MPYSSSAVLCRTSERPSVTFEKSVICAQDMAIRGDPANRELELVWRGAASYGSSADVFTGNFYSGVPSLHAPSFPTPPTLQTAAVLCCMPLLEHLLRSCSLTKTPSPDA
jgi:hypothetical protein